MERCVVLEECREAGIEIDAIAVSDLLFIHICGGTWRELRALFFGQSNYGIFVCYRKRVVYLYVGMRICIYAAMSPLRVFIQLCGYLDMRVCRYADVRICVYGDSAICFS